MDNLSAHKVDVIAPLIEAIVLTVKYRQLNLCFG
jgi:hypothetical protein